MELLEDKSLVNIFGATYAEEPCRSCRSHPAKVAYDRAGKMQIRDLYEATYECSPD